MTQLISASLYQLYLILVLVTWLSYICSQVVNALNLIGHHYGTLKQMQTTIKSHCRLMRLLQNFTVYVFVTLWPRHCFGLFYKQLQVPLVLKAVHIEG